MISDGLVILYTAKAKPGKAQEVRDLLVAGVTGSRHDPGNISYEVHELVGDPSTLVIVEQWVSQEALDAHLATPALRRFKDKAETLLEGGFDAGLQQLKKLRPRPDA